MSEGRPAGGTKSTIYVGNLADEIDEQALIEVFSTFGDIMEVQIPTVDQGPYQTGRNGAPIKGSISEGTAKHRGYAFVAFATPADAQDAIDNMDLNEVRGKVIKVNLAKPMKGPVQGQGNRAIWETEEWLKNYGAQAPDGSAAPAGKDDEQAADAEAETEHMEE